MESDCRLRKRERHNDGRNVICVQRFVSNKTRKKWQQQQRHQHKQEDISCSSSFVFLSSLFSIVFIIVPSCFSSVQTVIANRKKCLQKKIPNVSFLGQKTAHHSYGFLVNFWRNARIHPFACCFFYQFFFAQKQIL